MLRFRLLIALLLIASLLVTIPAGAITYGESDDGGHPHVGALVIDDGSGKRHICSGTLISDDVFLTAAHCTVAAEQLTGSNHAFVTFDEEVDADDGTFHEGTMVTNPEYEPNRQNDPGDIAVVLLDESPGIETPIELPALGFLDDANEQNGLKGETFRNVGYGVNEPQVGPGGPVFSGSGTRMVSESSFLNVRDAWLLLSQTNATNDSGTCFGDSGGPQFLGDTDTIVSITVTGDAMCLSTNQTYRLDTDASRAFLEEFVNVP